MTLLAVLFFAGLAVAFGYPLVNGITHLADDLPGYVSKAEHGKGWIGHLVTRYHVQNWVMHNAPKLASYGKDLANPVISVGKGAITLVIELLTIFVLVVLLLIEGPKLRTGLLGLMSPARAAGTAHRGGGEQVRHRLHAGQLRHLDHRRARGPGDADHPRRPVPVPVGAVGRARRLPADDRRRAGRHPGRALRADPVLTAGLVTLIVFLLYTQVENHVLNPVIMSRTVRINPLLVLVSILVGASIGSWIGGFFGGFVVALLSIPLAGALQVIVREAWRSTDPAAPDPAVVNPAAPPGAELVRTGSARRRARPAARPRERRAVPRLPSQWGRRLPRRPDSAAEPPA